MIPASHEEKKKERFNIRITSLGTAFLEKSLPVNKRQSQSAS